MVRTHDYKIKIQSKLPSVFLNYENNKITVLMCSIRWSPENLFFDCIYKKSIMVQNN